MCNLKANKTFDEMQEYLKDVSDLNKDENLVIFPSNLYLSMLKKTSVTFGSQDISDCDYPSTTGEITAKQVKSTGAKYTIIGHSERRLKHNEDEYILNKKIRQALNADLKVVYCIGETKEEKARKKTYQVLEKQIAKIFNLLSYEDMKRIIIAYEPCWAIGTGISAKASEIEEIVNFIKKMVLDYFEVEVKVLYGGSVNSENLITFNKLNILDGFLVGKASLDILEVSKMHQMLLNDPNSTN